MAYISTSELQAEYRGVTFSISTTPTLANVTIMIDEESSFIDATLNNYISVPVSQTTSPNFYSILQRICKKIVKNRVNAIMRMQTGSDKDEESPENLENKARKELRTIIDRKEFYDASRVSTNQYGISDGNYTNSIEPVFNIDDDVSLGDKD